MSSIIIPDYINLDIEAFENFLLADNPFAKGLRIFETCVSVDNNLCENLVLSLEFPIRIDERYKLFQFNFLLQILTY